MTILGNILLALATLLFCLLFSLIYLKQSPRGGDAAMGHVWSIMLLNLAFLILMILVALIIGSKGGFGWVSSGKTARFLLVTLGLLASVTTVAAGALFYGEPGPFAAFINRFLGFTPALVPVLLILGSAILLNDGLRNSFPASAFKIPLITAFGLGVLGASALLLGLISESNQNTRRSIEQMYSDQDQNHARQLADIDSCDVSKDLVFILVFTDANHDDDIRARALAKIKSRPDWQEELIRRLDSGWAREPFTFLASNAVDNPELFLEPVRLGILNVAKSIREEIRRSDHASNFYPERFSWEVARILRTVEKFEGKGVDYLPAVRELRAALDEPSSVEKSSMECSKILDKWIHKRQ